MTEQHEIEPAFWACIFDNGNMRAWTRDRLRADMWRLDGLDMVPFYSADALERLSAEATDWFRTAAKNQVRAQAAEARLIEAEKLITMSDVRLMAGEGKLSARDTLNAVNAVLRMRSGVESASACGSAFSEDGE